MSRVLVTGPMGRAQEYAAAAVAAGWEAEALELLEIRTRALTTEDIPAELEVLCITSKHALAALPPLSAPCAVVGEETAARLRERGLRIAVGPARSASDLAREMAERFAPGTRVFWPRGSLSDDLAQDLRRRGLDVTDVVAYETLERELEGGELPEADALFLASPSAVRSAAKHGRAFGLAIAIGATTASELAAHDGTLGEVHVLEHPTPDSLATCLRGLAPAT